MPLDQQQPAYGSGLSYVTRLYGIVDIKRRNLFRAETLGILLIAQDCMGSNYSPSQMNGKVSIIGVNHIAQTI